MLCPNCQRQMSYKNETFRGIDFGGTAEDHELMEAYEEYKCPRCGIERINGKWRIPESLKPSPKQVNAILFINARLNTGIEPLTKSQCWRDTQKHFEAAKNKGRLKTNGAVYGTGYSRKGNRENNINLYNL